MVLREITEVLGLRPSRRSQPQYFGNFPQYHLSFVRAPDSLWLSRVSECRNIPHDFQDRSHRFPDQQPELAKPERAHLDSCLLYTSDAADDLLCVDLGGRRIIK